MPHILWRPLLRTEAPILYLGRLRFKSRSSIEAINLQFGMILIEFREQSMSKKIRLWEKLLPQSEQGLKNQKMIFSKTDLRCFSTIIVLYVLLCPPTINFRGSRMIFLLKTFFEVLETRTVKKKRTYRNLMSTSLKKKGPIF